MTELVSYYRKNLADEQRSQETDADADLCWCAAIQPKESVRQALSEEGICGSGTYAEKMNQYLSFILKLLIQARLNPDNLQRFERSAGVICKSQYDQIENLRGAENLDRLEQMKNRAERLSGPYFGDEQNLRPERPRRKSQRPVKQEYTVTIKQLYQCGHRM